MLIVYADGIGTGGQGFANEGSILYKVVEQLLERRPSARATKVRWPASMAGIGGNLSWIDASRQGVEEIDSILSSNPEEKFILLGYSGGCRVIHEWLDSRLGDLHRIEAVGLMSDPFRPKQRWQNGLPEPRGWGICGAKLGPIPDRTYWTTVPGDVISDAVPDAILRTPADVSDVMPGSFLWDLRNHIKKGDLQLGWQIGVIRRNPFSWFIGLGPRLHQARMDIRGYLTGQHTNAYIEPFEGGDSLAVRLANTINWSVNERERKRAAGLL